MLVEVVLGQWVVVTVMLHRAESEEVEPGALLQMAQQVLPIPVVGAGVQIREWVLQAVGVEPVDC